MIWAPLIGQEFVRATLSRNHYFQLVNMLHFDDRAGRRKDLDKFAALCEFHEKHQENLSKHFVPGPTLTADEQFVPFRGRCSFLQHMPSKSCKYGLKLFWLCDAETFYPLKCIPYLGKDDGNLHDEGLNQGTSIVDRLVQPYTSKGRNVTMSNFFTDMEVVDKLAEKNTTLVGTVRRNKNFLPPPFKVKKQQVLYSSNFAFNNETNTMLFSYQSHRNKNVVVLSTMHNEREVADGEKRKPDVLLFYNQTKGGVDKMDKLAQTYTTKRASKRWPMVLFYNILDLSGIAAGVVFKLKNPASKLCGDDNRADFLRDIAKSLMGAQIRRRNSMLTKASKALRQTMDNCQAATHIHVLQPAPSALQEEIRKRKRGRCSMCNWRQQRKGSNKCHVCQSSLCKEHSIITCAKCKGQ
ncbi:PiggyBac transposable element-derived protein 4 [Elysia marginata]|uniref:PiggyBac transposable element-derived protein 4 n=1 Tax=Elysia marginata TaxID=1093978 RepID=A0AAV4G7L1_9GAST|nr:PiggyBac transposable element-derived protein 4 [Elysia marginata]